MPPPQSGVADPYSYQVRVSVRKQFWGHVMLGAVLIYRIRAHTCAHSSISVCLDPSSDWSVYRADSIIESLSRGAWVGGGGGWCS